MSRCASTIGRLRTVRGSFVRSYRIQGVDGLNPMQEAERFLQSQRVTKMTREANTSRFYKSRKVFGYAETRHLAETKQAKIESHMSPDIVIVSMDPFAAAPIETVKAQKKEGFRFVSALFAAPLLIPVFFVGKVAIDKESRQRLASYFSAEQLSSKYGIPFKKGTVSLAVNTPYVGSVLSDSNVSNPSVVSVVSTVVEAKATSHETSQQSQSINDNHGIESLVSSQEMAHSSQEHDIMTLEPAVATATSVLPDPDSSLPTGASVQPQFLKSAEEDTKNSSEPQATFETSVVSDSISEKAFVLSDDITEGVKELDKETHASDLNINAPASSDFVGSPVQDSTHPATVNHTQENIQVQETQQSPKQKLLDSLEQLRLNPPQKGASRDEVRLWRAKKAELKKAIKNL